MLGCSTLTRRDGSLERLIQNRVYVLQDYIAQVSVKKILVQINNFSFSNNNLNTSHDIQSELVVNNGNSSFGATVVYLFQV